MSHSLVLVVLEDLASPNPAPPIPSPIFQELGGGRLIRITVRDRRLLRGRSATPSSATGAGT